MAEVAKLDIAANALVLGPYPEGGGTYASYYGYVTCMLRIPEEGLSRAVPLPPQEFRDLAALLPDDAEVKLVPGASALQITASTGRRMSLRYSTRTNEPPPLGQPEKLAIVDREAFTREATAALQVTADSLAVPVLRGVRIAGSVTAGKVAFQSANGTSLVFESNVLAAVETNFDLVAPSTDLLTALRVLNGDQLHIMRKGNTLLLQTTDVIVRVGTLAGTWPNLSSVRGVSYTEEVTISAATIRALVAAAKVYQVSREAIIRPADDPGIIWFETREGEAGQFQETAEGILFHSYVFDIDNLEQAAKMSGEKVKIRLAERLALVSVGSRRLFMNHRLTI